MKRLEMALKVEQQFYKQDLMVLSSSVICLFKLNLLMVTGGLAEDMQQTAVKGG